MQGIDVVQTLVDSEQTRDGRRLGRHQFALQNAGVAEQVQQAVTRLFDQGRIDRTTAAEFGEEADRALASCRRGDVHRVGVIEKRLGQAEGLKQPGDHFFLRGIARFEAHHVGAVIQQ
ncbi:hypothetical protein D3C86_1393160 [compost metagenome]